jgi:hypothetical protein
VVLMPFTLFDRPLQIKSLSVRYGTAEMTHRCRSGKERILAVRATTRVQWLRMSMSTGASRVRATPA